MSSRSLKADDGKGVFCSGYTDVHIVNFSYTIDTANSDTLDWLSRHFLPCMGGRSLVDYFGDGGTDVNELESMTGIDSLKPNLRGRFLRPDVSRELGIVGLKSWPDDILSSSSNCFPTNNSNDACTVVFGTVSAYLNPISADVVSDAQIEDVERNIRYQIMTLMRSGMLETQLESVEHARYLSPVVVMKENEVRINPESQPYLHFTQHSDSSGMTVTQSIVIIAACFVVIGAAGLILTLKALFRQEEDYFTVKQQQTADDDSMVPQPHSQPDNILPDEKNAALTRQHHYSSQQFLKEQPAVEPREAKVTSAHNNNDFGTNANMSATMRRMIVTKKVPVVRARSGAVINLGSVVEEDDEEEQDN